MTDLIEQLRNNPLPEIPWEDFRTLPKGTKVACVFGDSLRAYEFDRFDAEATHWWGPGETCWFEEDGPFYLITEAPKPPLPTEVGSMIAIHAARGVRVDPPVRAMLDGEGDWLSSARILRSFSHRPGHITSWTVLKVVEA